MSITNIVLKERDKEEIDTLRTLMKRHAFHSDSMLVQKMIMGGTESFIGAVDLEWFGNKVNFARELPLFRRKLDPETNEIIKDKDTIDEVLQRPLDFTRESSLAQYLIGKPGHKFPAVLVVISEKWVDDPSSDNWDEEGRAKISSATFTPLDENDHYGLLDVSKKDTDKDISLYALDGQHRLLGVKGLLLLIKEGKLQLRDKKGAYLVNSVLERETLEEIYQVTEEEIKALASEKMGIEFISAVVKGETREQSKRRVRSIFVHVNKMAASLTQGQLNQLDEDNGFALVAKYVSVHHEYLAKPKVVNMDNNTISGRSVNFTTLQTIKDMAEGYLGHKFPFWGESIKGVVPIRPSDDELEVGKSEVNNLIDSLLTLPNVERAVQGTSSVQLRKFTYEEVSKSSELYGEGHLFFRPVGQQIFAATIGGIMSKGSTQSLDDLIHKIQKLDEGGFFSAIDKPHSVWYGVIYEPIKKKMLVSGKKLAIRLLAYVLDGGLVDKSRKELQSDFAAARTIDGETIDYDGQLVLPSRLKLPNPQ
ncbi:hypothetical protein GCM10007916_10090 [Psychromonas marina]|uniref:DGQHR domain-containing protein n=1 Tax=Psychromonas marina TaxID=88364 RepID=A0ABQ6DXW8_9GAMM|nr:DGQHR domain-containing protein [Psychromonas marina]GLS89942.1 hypothetical protein GCM10007916_10090 [Psychromonas marina]